MQDNDFEKQVHHKMGELKLLPSEAVWEKVEMRLQQKEERRRWLIWLPLLIAGLSLGGYWAWNKLHTSSEKHLPALVNTQKGKQPQYDHNNALQKDKVIIKINGKKETAITDKIPEKAIISNHNQTIKNNLQENKNAAGQPDKLILKAGRSVADDYAGAPSKSSYHKKSGGKILADVRVDTSEYLLENNKIPEIKQPENSLSVLDTKEPELSNQQHVIKELFPVVIKENPVSFNPPNTSLLQVNGNLNAKTVTLGNTNRNWQWGISFQAGRSSLTSGSFNTLFGGGGGANKDYSSVIVSLPNNNNANGNGNNAIPKVPSPLQSATGFSAGAVVKKQLSRRFSISVGLNYTLYTATNMVGTKIDSSMTLQTAFSSSSRSFGQYYRLGSTDRYVNKYHFIELPVSLQTRLSRNPKMPLSWDFGFSISKLIASNALNFDNVAGVYYRDSQQLNKTQFNILTGVPVSLFPGRKFGLQVGPEFQYGLSNVFNNQTNNDKHFFFLGLKAALLLGKK